MKKIIIVFLVLIICFALSACGGEEIEISMDNVEQYFEIKEEVVEFQKDEFGKPFVTVSDYIAVKEEYADRIQMDECDIVVQVKAGEYVINRDNLPRIDFENKMFARSEDVEYVGEDVRTLTLDDGYWYSCIDNENSKCYVWRVSQKYYDKEKLNNFAHFDHEFECHGIEFVQAKGIIVIK